VANAGCPVVLMHNRSKPKNVDQHQRLGGRYVGIHYDDLMDDIKKEIQESVAIAIDGGINEEKIIIDPGIGFGKTVGHNLMILRDLHRLKDLGFPLLVGPSRKSFIGYTLNLPPDERLEGTAAAVVLSIEHGADVVRVHDVKEMVRLVRMTDAIVRH
jgi:dihydropteroate synthase